MLQLIFESVFIGVYCLALYYILTFIISKKNWVGILFILGFLKHFLSYFLGFQSYFCNYGLACQTGIIEPTKIADGKHLVIESLWEGLAFIIIGIVFLVVRNPAVNHKRNQQCLFHFNLITVFLLGFTVHILAEIGGIHQNFCAKHCKTRF